MKVVQGLWPTFAGRLVGWKVGIFSPGERGCTAGDEHETGIIGLEKQWGKVPSQDMSPGDVDIVGLVPHFSCCHLASSRLLIELSTFDLSPGQYCRKYF